MTFEHFHEYLFFLIVAQTFVIALIRASKLAEDRELIIWRAILHAGAVAIVTNSIILGLANGLFYILLCFTRWQAVTIHVILQIVWAWIAWSTVNPQGIF